MDASKDKDARAVDDGPEEDISATKYMSLSHWIDWAYDSSCP